MSRVDVEEFEAVCDALKRLDVGESYRSVAKDTRFTRRTLSKIDQDPERRQWNLEEEADKEKIQTALDEVYNQ